MFLGDIRKCLLTLDREPTTDQSKESTEVQPGELVSLWELLTGVEMTQKPEASQKAHSSMGGSS